MVTERPRASRMEASDAAAMPLPSEDTTPPVTKIRGVMGSSRAGNTHSSGRRGPPRDVAGAGFMMNCGCVARFALREAATACFVREGRSGFVRLPAPEFLSLCVAKEKGTKEKGHPGWRLPGVLPGKCVSRGRAFRAGSCPREKARPSVVSPAARPGRPRLTAAQGPPKSRRASRAPEATATATAERCKLAAHLPPLHAREGRGGVLLLLRAGSALLYPVPLWRGGWGGGKSAGWP